MAKAKLYYVLTQGIKYGFFSTSTNASKLGKAKEAKAGDSGVVIGCNNPKPRKAYCNCDTGKVASFFVDDSVTAKDLVGKSTQKAGKITSVRFR
jgi:hypothetical protein